MFDHPLSEKVREKHSLVHDSESHVTLFRNAFKCHSYPLVGSDLELGLSIFPDYWGAKELSCHIIENSSIFGPTHMKPLGMRPERYPRWLIHGDGDRQ